MKSNQQDQKSLQEDHRHLFVDEKGAEAHIIHTVIDGKDVITTHLPLNFKTHGSRIINHKTLSGAERRLAILGFKKKHSRVLK